MDGVEREGEGGGKQMGQMLALGESRQQGWSLFSSCNLSVNLKLYQNVFKKLIVLGAGRSAGK